jgi:hypothetical protein
MTGRQSRFVRADITPSAGSGTSGESVSQYHSVYFSSDGKYYKADNTTAAKSAVMGIAAAAASADGALLFVSHGKWRAIISGSVTMGDKLVASATAGRLSTSAGTHTHTVTVGTEAYPSGVALNFNDAGATGSKFTCTSGGTETTSAANNDRSPVITALETGTDGSTIDVWLG